MSHPSWWPSQDELSGQARADWVSNLNRALGPLNIPYAPFMPNPGRQEAFLRLNCLEAFYGGAAGGGKSVALMMGALRFVNVPGYAALILRRTYPDLRLPGALMDMANEWLMDTDAKWWASDYTWHFPSTATITFGHLQKEDDKYRYRSAEFQYIAFDELTAFQQTQYLYLFSRLRRPARTTAHANNPYGVNLGDVPLRMRSASNPGGPGHEWVRSRFIDPTTRDPDVVFMPAVLDDNPHLDKATYEQALQMLMPSERERLLHGDWDVLEEGQIDRTWFPIIDQVPPLVRSVRSWDFAASAPDQRDPDPDWTVGTLYHLARDGGFVIGDVVRGQWNPADVEKNVRQTAELDGRGVHVLFEIEGGAAGKSLYDHYARHVLPGWPVSGHRPSGEKWVRARPAIAAAANGLVAVVRGAWTRDWLNRMGTMYPGGPMHDDELDSWSQAHTYLTRGASRAPTVVSPASVRI